MNDKAAPKNPLLRPVSPITQSKILEAIFQSPPNSYLDEITYQLTLFRQVLSGLSALNEGNLVTGDFAAALSVLLAQQVDVAIILLHGSLFDNPESPDVVNGTESFG